MSSKEDFIKKIIKIIDRWSFEQCAFCDGGAMSSLDGMLDFRCNKCGKSMDPIIYLGEIAKAVFNYRKQQENNKEGII
ncbi:MAG: hypothetical protein ACFFAQ_03545 [Promethearchaeota archaeon]